MAELNPLLKANLIAATPQSNQLAPLYFTHGENVARLLKFLKRTKLIDASLKVLSVHYAFFVNSQYLCGQVVYN